LAGRGRDAKELLQPPREKRDAAKRKQKHSQQIDGQEEFRRALAIWKLVPKKRIRRYVEQDSKRGVTNRNGVSPRPKREIQGREAQQTTEVIKEIEASKMGERNY